MSIPSRECGLLGTDFAPPQSPYVVHGMWALGPFGVFSAKLSSMRPNTRFRPHFLCQCPVAARQNAGERRGGPSVPDFGTPFVLCIPQTPAQRRAFQDPRSGEHSGPFLSHTVPALLQGVLSDQQFSPSEGSPSASHISLSLSLSLFLSFSGFQSTLHQNSTEQLRPIMGCSPRRFDAQVAHSICGQQPELAVSKPWKVP